MDVCSGSKCLILLELEEESTFGPHFMAWRRGVLCLFADFYHNFCYGWLGSFSCVKVIKFFGGGGRANSKCYNFCPIKVMERGGNCFAILCGSWVCCN